MNRDALPFPTAADSREYGCNAPYPGVPEPARTDPTRRQRLRAIRGWYLRPRTVLPATAVVAALAASAAWQWCRARNPFDESELTGKKSAQICCDRYGTPVWAELDSEDQWRIPVRLSSVSPWLVAAAVAVEDRRFFRHHGVDWLAGVRAMVSNLRAGRIVSGASTLTMQLAKLARLEPRSYVYKVHQIFRALDIENRHDKDWVLEQYLNFAPFGGNLVGVEAASLAYFGKPARDLNLPEAALLAGLPQRPAHFQPTRHPVAAERRRRAVLEAMVRADVISRQRFLWAESITVPMLIRRQPPNVSMRCNRLGLSMSEPLFGRLALAAAPSTAVRVRSTLDPHTEAVTRTALRTQVEHLPGVKDGAAVVIENATGAVRALVGTVDFGAPVDGQVNAACEPRSPGSALKPFLYLTALDGGLIVPETVLDDSPLVLKDYHPQNFDHRFRGQITAQQALTASLNTPAIRLLRQVGVARFLSLLRRCGVRTDRGRTAAQLGLTAILGSVEISPLDLANLYAGIARGGRFFPCRFVADMPHAESASVVAPFTPGAVCLLTRILSTCPLPGCPTTAMAWKTGTSSGRRDAWCVAWNRRWTIVVWFGNKSGRAAAALVGAEAAAPAVAAIVQGLDGGAAPPTPVQSLDIATCTVPVRLCTETGLRAGLGCPSVRLGRRPAGVPLRPCPGHNARFATTSSRGCTRPVRILSPVPGTYLAEADTVPLKVRAAPDTACAWFIDGRFVGRRDAAFWVHFARGRHRVRCVPTGLGAGAEVALLVR